MCEGPTPTRKALRRRSDVQTRESPICVCVPLFSSSWKPHGDPENRSPTALMAGCMGTHQARWWLHLLSELHQPRKAEAFPFASPLLSDGPETQAGPGRLFPFYAGETWRPREGK